MNENTDTPTAAEARAALDSVAEYTAAGFRRGIYPRWFGMVTALWGGAIAVCVVAESAIWVLLMLAGFIGYGLYRQRHGAWAREVHNRHDLVLVIAVTIFFCGIIAAGLAFEREIGAWAPIGAGTIIALSAYGIMEYSYHAEWSRSKEDRES